MDLFNSLKKSADDDFKASNYEEAVQKYTLLLKNKNENNNLIYLNRCLSYLKLNKLDEALEDAKDSIKLKSDNAKAWGRLGSCLLAKKNNDQAKIAFLKAFELEPNNEEYKKLALDENIVEEENDDDMIAIMNKLKNLNFIKNMDKDTFPKGAIEELEKIVPLDGVMGNILNKMMNNENLLSLMDDNEFQKKMESYSTNPLLAMQDPQIMNLMKDILKN
jgi:tetratricopeptide (TPR) repeat protein